METLFYLLIIIFIGILVWIVLVWSTQNRGDGPELRCLGSVSEPEAYFWRNILKSIGIWADIRHVEGVAALSIELGSARGYEVWVKAADYSDARSALGMDKGWD